MQRERKIYYLKKYLPLLNTLFKSNFSESQIYDTLYTKLKSKQENLNSFDSSKKKLGVPVYLYNYVNYQIMIKPN